MLPSPSSFPTSSDESSNVSLNLTIAFFDSFFFFLPKQNSSDGVLTSSLLSICNRRLFYYRNVTKFTEEKNSNKADKIHLNDTNGKQTSEKIVWARENYRQGVNFMRQRKL